MAEKIVKVRYLKHLDTHVRLDNQSCGFFFIYFYKHNACIQSLSLTVLPLLKLKPFKISSIYNSKKMELILIPVLRNDLS